MNTDDASLSVSDDSPPARHRKWRTLLLALLGLAALLAVLTLSFAPIVGEPKAPDTPSVDAARGLVKQITGGNADAGDRLSLHISQLELDGLVQLSNQALAPLRVDAELVGGPDRGEADHMSVSISYPVALGAWVNVAATARSRAAEKSGGLPDIGVNIGSLPVPQWLTHFVLRRLWLTMQGDVAKPLALDDAIRRTTITQSHIRLVMAHPGRAAGFAGLVKARGAVPDAAFVASTYCALTRYTGTDMAELVRNAWALPAPERMAPEDHNRALLLAIAMRAVPEYRDRLAGAALPLIARCPAPPANLVLTGRVDLSRHWSLSAALAATLGGQMARSMGAWKELADSAEGGSGFSFVDLAGDRSGERFGTAAVDPKVARAVATRMGAITQEQMLPAQLLTKPEGLNQAAFERDYSAIDSPEYLQAIKAIDAILNSVGVPTL